MPQRVIRARLRWIVVLLAGTLLPGSGFAAEVKPLLPDEKAFGMTLTEWATAWWQWQLSIPASVHPRDDATGIRAGIGQRLPVWFLPHSRLGTTDNRTIYVPAGYGILFPGATLVGWEFPEARDDEARFDDHDRVAEEWRDTIKVLEVSIDGAPLPDPQKYLVQTPIFTVALPPGNRLNVPVTAGEDHRMAVIGTGHFFLLPSLSVGKHVIQVKLGQEVDNKLDTRTPVYNLIILEPNKIAE